ncbi:MAG: hypothetical protein JKY62_08120 [Desulfocapsa sp.]|nr:hypothetical protein [Desulfocapsa sp.]
MSDTLIFVYNADSGLFNTLTDTAHKLFSPKTYECNLCAMTFSGIGMKQEWRKFIDTIDLPLEFLHKDEFKDKYKTEVELPAIFLKSGNDLNLSIDAEAINKCKEIDELKQLIREIISV